MYFSHEVDSPGSSEPILHARTVLRQIDAVKGKDAESQAKRDQLKKVFIVAAGVESLTGKHYYRSEVSDIELQMMKFASELGLKVPSFKSCMSSVAGVEIDPKAYTGIFSDGTGPDLTTVYSVLLSLDAVEGLAPSVQGKREEALKAFRAKNINGIKKEISDLK